METTAVTGDEILDFVRWMWPKDFETALPHYRALAQRLKGRIGQYVLMIERREDSGGGCVIRMGPPVEETFTLGILTADTLKLEKVGEGIGRGKLSFPTGRWAATDGDRHRKGGLHDGDIRPWIYDTTFFFKIGQPMEIRHHDSGGCFGSSGMSVDFCLGADSETPFSELEFHVGNEEIDAWCRRGAMHYRKDQPNEARCEMIADLAKSLGSSAKRIPAIVAYREIRGAKILADLAKQAEALRIATEELQGEKDPDRPADLVKRYRAARQEIRRLLDEAEKLGSEDPFVKRLRAAHPPKPAT